MEGPSSPDCPGKICLFNLSHASWKEPLFWRPLDQQLKILFMSSRWLKKSKPPSRQNKLKKGKVLQYRKRASSTLVKEIYGFQEMLVLTLKKKTNKQQNKPQNQQTNTKRTNNWRFCYRFETCESEMQLYSAFEYVMWHQSWISKLKRNILRILGWESTRSMYMSLKQKLVILKMVEEKQDNNKASWFTKPQIHLNLPSKKTK